YSLRADGTRARAFFPLLAGSLVPSASAVSSADRCKTRHSITQDITIQLPSVARDSSGLAQLPVLQ
ncbi:unnamed protein product, partial [Tilletia caries]